MNNEQLDRVVAETVLGWKGTSAAGAENAGWPGSEKGSEVPRFSTDPCAAIQLALHLTRDPEVEFDLRIVGGGHVFASFTDAEGTVHAADNPSLPFAICLAAARMKGLPPAGD